MGYADDQLNSTPKTYTQYEQVAVTCYSSRCTSQTGITSASSPISIPNLLSTYTSPYFQDTDKLYFSM